MSFAFKKASKLFGAKKVVYVILGLVLALILLSFFFIIYNQNTNAVKQFNQQTQGLAKTSTVYLVNNFDLYGSPTTIKYQNIVNDFLKENDGVSKFQIFNTEGAVVFDSINIKDQKSDFVGDEILNLSRNDKITSLFAGNRVRVIVSPYFEEWGVHKYSVLLYPSYAQVNKDNWQFNLESGTITLLLIITIITIVALYTLNAEFKVHQEEKERLEILDKQRQEFMMLVAHNLRTPITIIQGYLSLLAESKISKDQKELVEPVRDATNNLNRLVENILTVTTVLGQNALISKEIINFPEFIAGILKGHQEKIKSMQISVTETYKPEDLVIFANRQYAELIFDSLIGNAVKFNKENGKISLRGRREGDNIVLDIADTGIGIAKKAQEGVFAEFHKSDTDGNKFVYNYEGSGLGLYASKVLIEAMGGKVWFESEEGKGTTFTVSLPSSDDPA